MKFVKGMVVGTLMSAGIVMLCSETMTSPTTKMIKKGKQFCKKMGIM